MKKTFKHFLIESQKLPHWPKTVEELKKIYAKICVDPDSGEVMMPMFSDLFEDASVKFNDDVTVSIDWHHRVDRIQIQDWNLVDGQMPFPFKDVKTAFVISQGCKLKSLAGVPRSCEVFTIEEQGLDSTVKDLVGGPEEVNSSFSVFACDGIEYIRGFPTKIGNDMNLSIRFCKNFKDFSGIPEKLGNFNLSSTEHFTNDNLKDLPKEVDTLSLDQLPKLTSLHNIHKYVKSAKRITLYQTKIFSSILGLAMINGLNEVEESFYDVNNEDKSWPTDGIIPIVEKYIGSHDVFEFQEELVDAGFTELAKI